MAILIENRRFSVGERYRPAQGSGVGCGVKLKNGCVGDGVFVVSRWFFVWMLWVLHATFLD